MPLFPHLPSALRDVLREKGQALFSGRIDVDTNGLAGVVHLSDGIVLEAKLGSAVGEPALWRMLLPDKPRITMEAGKPRATSGAVLGNTDALLQRFDERLAVLERYAEKVGGFERVWAIRFDALAAVLEELPDAINPVLRLLDGKRSVRQVVAECPLDDMLALRILGKMLSVGILVLPDSEVAKVVAAHVIDVDEGLEAALAASLAEIDDEDAHEPIPLTAARVAPSTSPAPSMSLAPALTPQPPSSPSPTSSLSAPLSSLASPLEAQAPRAVTMRPAEVSVPPDVTLPVVIGLPSAPPVETTSDLRSWLGSEEAFFQTNAARPRTADVVVRPAGAKGLSPLWMVAILAVGVALGALMSLKGC